MQLLRLERLVLLLLHLHLLMKLLKIVIILADWPQQHQQRLQAIQLLLVIDPQAFAQARQPSLSITPLSLFEPGQQLLTPKPLESSLPILIK